MPGIYRGRKVTIQDSFEAPGLHASGEMSEEDVDELVGRACPGAGACGGMFTANTMAAAAEALGMAPPGALPFRPLTRGARSWPFKPASG